ncbi:SHD1 domain-containing protein [Planctomicrobium sp. SH664]|uniref:SHD1 domain-containing protein n=1 Tax=Planctomicrobium sp. SH664 TaxID=3448125 RepID=UPI003F5C3FD7
MNPGDSSSSAAGAVMLQWVMRAIWGLVFGLLLFPSSSGAGEIRKWKDSTGKNTIEAELVSRTETKVKLRGTNGKTYEIEISKLSEADQEFLKAGEANPFQEVPDDALKARVRSRLPASVQNRMQAGNSSSGAESVVSEPINWLSVKKLSLKSSPDWNYAPQPVKLNFKPKGFPLPKLPFPHSLFDLVINAKAQRGVLCSQGGGPNWNTVITVVDLSAGRVMTSATLPENLVVLSIDDTGRSLLVKPGAFYQADKSELLLYTLSGNELTLKHRASIAPPDQPGFSHVEFAEFAGTDRIAVLSSNGQLSLWDVNSFSPVAELPLGIVARAALSPDRQTVAFTDNKVLGLLDVNTAELLGTAPMADGMLPQSLSFGPSGDRLAGIGGERTVIWNLSDASVISDFPLLRAGGEAALVKDDFLLVGHQKLYDISNQIALWNYLGGQKAASAGGTTFFAVQNSGENGMLMVGELPHQKAVDALEQAQQRSDLFALKPGGEIALDLSGLPADLRDTVQQDFTSKLAKYRISIREGAPATLKAGIRQQNKQQDYIIFGKGRESFSVNEQISFAQIMVDGKIAWGQQASNVPAGVRTKEGESFQDALNRITEKPNVKFFENVRLPQVVQRNSGGPTDSQFLGSSRVSAKGVQ